MSLGTVLLFLLATTSFTLSRSQELEISTKGLEIPSPPVKIDKNLRQALLKALADLEAESAEQHKDENVAMAQRSVGSKLEDIAKKDLNKDLGIVQKPTFSFNGFPGDEEIPSEDKLQNSSFVQARFVTTKLPSMTIEKASRDDARSFHVQNVIMPTKNTVVYTSKTEGKVEQLGKKQQKASASSTSVTKVESITLKPATQISESLAGSASSSIAIANALASPKPTVASPTVTPNTNATTASKVTIEKSEEVKIFQAPLVAAFTVQQDERGVPKSVVPIYRSTNDGQALTLQEQLEFKQRLLEKQLAELQQQQLQQTQFLLRQRQLYEQQVRQKQQQFYLQEQAKLKQLEEQTRLKQLEEQRLKQLDEQRLFRFQQHNFPPKQRFFEQSNNVLPIQPNIDTNVHLQPSVSLEVPNAAPPPPFQGNYQEQLRLHQRQQTQSFSQQAQHQQSQLHQSQHQQQRHQQSFSGFPTEFQPPVSNPTRFNRQEAFNSIGNFGFNFDNKPTANRNSFGFNTQPSRPPTNFAYNPYVQYRQPRPQTPAKQIQHLLYQSGIAGDIGGAQGSGGQEDLNILSKVLALNVGALPVKNTQYTSNSRSNGLLGQVSA